jgi:hypothetical protein
MRQTTTTERYQDWKAPSEDGGVLVWPGEKQFQQETAENQKRLNGKDGARISGAPLKELRLRMRAWLGHQEIDQAIMATGHQAELYHPGVWVKNVVIDAAARRVGGEAIHFAIDSDEPKHLHLKWPDENWPITDDPNLPLAAWSALVAAPTPGHLKMVEEEARRIPAQWGYEPELLSLLDSMRRLALAERSLPGMLVDATHELDWGLGLKYQMLLASPIWAAEPYLMFVQHLLANAAEFAGQYNSALHEYRKQEGIKAPGRPMPDLKVNEEGIEAPFWIDDLADGTRQRAWLTRKGSELLLGEFPIGKDGWDSAQQLGMWLRQRGWRIAPRALTLTMFLRMCVADQWVHGIGGGRYDQVLDRLIERHFGMEAPRFAVATATLYFPGAIGRQRVCLPCIRQEGHRIRHAALGQEKMKLVEQIDSLPRHSVQRGVLFQEMHRRLSDAVQSNPAIREWEKQARQSELRAEEELTLFDRELFYALQPEGRLTDLIQRVRQVMG